MGYNKYVPYIIIIMYRDCSGTLTLNFPPLRTNSTTACNFTPS